MNPEELNKCLQKCYVAARKKDGNYYNRKSLTAIRAAIDRHLRSPPLSKPFSIVADSQFKEANKTLSNFLKNLSKNGEISGTKHKGAVTREVVQKLYEINELVGVNSLHPLKHMQTVWFYITLFLGKRGRENQAKMKKNFLVLRQDANGEKYFEINRERGAGVLTSKNHQGGLADTEDHSDGKIFARPGSSRCPVEIIQSYLSHLNPECSSLFQKARNQCKKFDPAVNTVWYAACPVGHNTLENLFRDMTSRAGIDPPMTNHCVRATSITVLSAANVERCHIKAITGHRSETSIQSYCDKPTFQQFKVMSNTLSDFIEDRDTALSPAQISAASAPAKKVPLATPSSSSTENIYFNRMNQDGSQHLIHGMVPGSTFHHCSFTFNVNMPGSSND